MAFCQTDAGKPKIKRFFLIHHGITNPIEPKNGKPTSASLKLSTSNNESNSNDNLVYIIVGIVCALLLIIIIVIIVVVCVRRKKKKQLNQPKPNPATSPPANTKQHHPVVANKTVKNKKKNTNDEPFNSVKLTDESGKQETLFAIGNGNCLLIDKSPKELYWVLVDAFHDDAPSTFKNKDDFLKCFHGVIYEDNEDLTQRLILCLRHSEVLQDIEESTIVADLFRGFGDGMFKKYVKVVTLSTIPWSMMFSNSTAISPLCISMEYSDRNYVAAVIRLQERMIAKNGGKRFCKEFIKQCCTAFEKNTTNTNKLYSLICHIGRMCDGTTDPEKKEYNRNIVKQMIRKLDPDLCYFNVSPLLSAKTTTTLFKDVEKEETMESIPHYAKFILIAAFFCSFNRQATDMRFFNKEQEGRKRTAVRNIEPNKFHETGPQSFTLTRLMGVLSFIFNDFLKEQETIPSDIERMINRLCDMRILTRISTSNIISNVKFRCDASSDFVRDIASSLGIEISDYLDGDVHDLVNKLQLIKIT